MTKGKKYYVLDTSALLTFIEEEEGSQYVENLLIQAERGEIRIYISFISLTEIFYITLREQNEEIALERIKLIQSLAVMIQESDENLNLSAGRLKAANSVSLADAYIAALCQSNRGILIHKDPEFEKLSEVIKEHSLPYKKVTT